MHPLTGRFIRSSLQVLLPIYYHIYLDSCSAKCRRRRRKSSKTDVSCRSRLSETIECQPYYCQIRASRFYRVLNNHFHPANSAHIAHSPTYAGKSALCLSLHTLCWMETTRFLQVYRYRDDTNSDLLEVHNYVIHFVFEYLFLFIFKIILSLHCFRNLYYGFIDLMKFKSAHRISTLIIVLDFVYQGKHL